MQPLSHRTCTLAIRRVSVTTNDAKVLPVSQLTGANSALRGTRTRFRRCIACGGRRKAHLCHGSPSCASSLLSKAFIDAGTHAYLLCDPFIAYGPSRLHPCVLHISRSIVARSRFFPFPLCARIAGDMRVAVEDAVWLASFPLRRSERTVARGRMERRGRGDGGSMRIVRRSV